MTRRLLVLRISIHGQPRSARAGTRHPGARRHAANGRRDVSRLLHSNVGNVVGLSGARDERPVGRRRSPAGSVLPAPSRHDDVRIGRSSEELPVSHRHEPDSRSFPPAAHRQRAAAGTWRGRHSRRRRSRAADAAAIGSAPRDGAAQPARARARVARVRTGIDAPGNCRRTRIEDRAASSRCCFARAGSLRGFWHHEAAATVSATNPNAPSAGRSSRLREQIRREFEHTQQQARVPTPEIVWWRAQMRAREEAARTAARPIVFTQALAVAALIGLLVSVVGRLTLPALSFIDMPPLPGSGLCSRRCRFAYRCGLLPRHRARSPSTWRFRAIAPRNSSSVRLQVDHSLRRPP